MNRKQVILVVIMVMTLLAAIAAILWSRRSNDSAETKPFPPASKLTYCDGEQDNPCVVSFSVDDMDNMLVNILVPEISFPNFYLKITHGGDSNDYPCQRVNVSLDHVYCTGAKMPPGVILHLTLISIKSETLLAEGDLSIIGLAFPTLEVIVPTQPEAPTMLAPSPTSTLPPLFILPTPTPTPTQPSYPAPSYPNQSYP